MVKDFFGKNRKLSEIWKGPYIITKVHSNDTVVIKKIHGTKEYLYNTLLLKKFLGSERKITDEILKEKEEAKNSISPPGIEPPAKESEKKIHPKFPNQDLNLTPKIPNQDLNLGQLKQNPHLKLKDMYPRAMSAEMMEDQLQDQEK